VLGTKLPAGRNFFSFDARGLAQALHQIASRKGGPISHLTRRKAEQHDMAVFLPSLLPTSRPAP
jgi:hypothetical protein